MRILHDAEFRLLMLQSFLEMLPSNAHDDTAEHCDEAPIAVLGEPLIPCLGRQSLDRSFRQPDIEDRVHHPRHGRSSSGSHRDQERT